MSKKRWSLPWIIILAMVSVWLTSVTPALARVYASIEPPPVQIEVPGPAPSPTHVWIGGYHRWDGRAYVWVPGHWVVRPPRRTAWVPGHWQRDRSGWYWVEGRW